MHINLFLLLIFNPLYSGKPLNQYFYSEDPDEMQHNAAFHQGLTVCKGKNNLQTK